MLGSGRIAGYPIADESGIIEALCSLARPEAFAARYGVDKPVLLFAIGDGNHFMAAKVVGKR
jgi:hypothetical protein